METLSQQNKLSQGHTPAQATCIELCYIGSSTAYHAFMPVFRVLY